MADYKQKIRKKLYKNYFTRMHESEKESKHTATRILNDEILEMFKKNKKKHLLDAGCGDGLFIKSAVEKNLRCEGFDTNEDLLSLCRKLGYKVKYGDLSKKLPYSAATFDGIYCSNVLEHMHEPDIAIHELLRILKKDGMLIITVPEGSSKLFFNDWTHVKGFTKKTFDGLMKCFDVKEHRIFRRHFPVLVRHWGNPLIRFFNLLIKKGIIASIFTRIFENSTYILRHDLIVVIRK